MRFYLLLSIVAVAYANRECDENAHFESCGTACPLTCDNHDNPPRFCILRCDIGCQCDEGYVRDSQGRCVKPEACPSKAQQVCGEYQRYLECGTACPLTCDNYQNPPKICPAMCVSGCHCEEGFVKTRDGRCVRPESCPSMARQVCGENQRYLECGTACPLTCDNYQNPPKICPAMCVSGCHCEEGFMKTRDGRCVMPESCPSMARPHEKSCLGKPDSGMCLAYMPSWYYNIQTGKCHEFIYGGCQGNGNNYATEEECMQHCENIKTKQSSSACDFPSEPGVCRGYFPRYYFDRTTGQCLRFIYGGCGGNENNFETPEECQEACAQSAPTACQQEKVVGPCKAAYRRFFFNKGTGKCEMFVYGGCNGNSNNFHSQEECEAVCAAQSAPTACQQEKVVGPCKAAYRRFFFNKGTGKCEMFVYGGCNGNSNNFHSQEECEAVCAA